MKFKLIFGVCIAVLIAVNMCYAIPQLSFVSPTPANNFQTANASAVINVSITENNLKEFKWNWNAVNYSFYDDNLVLMYSLDSGGEEIQPNSSEIVGLWHLNEISGNAVDSSGYSNTGTVSGAAQNAAGKLNSSYSFDGVNDYITIANNPSIQNMGNHFAVMAWVKPMSFPTGDPDWADRIISKGNDGQTGYYSLSIASGGHPEFDVKTDDGSRTLAQTTYSLTLGRWHHLAGLFNTTHLVLYIDGIEISSVAKSSSQVTTNTDSLFLGKQNIGGWEYFFNGGIDEVAIYNRSMSAAEVKAIYEKGIAKDASKYGNNGTIYGPLQAAGKYSKALSFDGVDDILNVSLSQDVGTIALWYKSANESSWNFVAKVNGTYYLNGVKQNSLYFPVSVEGNTIKVGYSNRAFRYYRLNILSSNNGWSYIGQFQVYDGNTVITPSSMTSDNSPSPYVTTTSYSWEGDGNWRKWYIYDSYIGTSPGGGMGWNTNPNSAAWSKIDLGASYPSTSYRIYSTSHNYWPNSWRIEGSNTGSFSGEEIILDSRSGIGNIGGDTYVSYNLAGNSYFNGSIDEVRIFSKNLSALEIQQLYYSNLNKYDTDKWQFVTNQSGLSTGTYTYQAFANNTGNNQGQTEQRTLKVKLPAVPVTYQKPEGGYASFDGTGDYVDLGSWQTPQDLSIDTWFYSKSWPSADATASLISQWEANSPWSSMALYFHTTGGNLYLRYAVDNDGGNRRYWATNPLSLALNQWHHLVVTQQGPTGTPVCYIDNSPYTFSIALSSGTPQRSSGHVSIARFGTSDGSYFNGYLDEINFYNRILSSSEVNQSYQRALQGKKSNITSGLVSYWDFENNGTADNTFWKDKKGSNHGTANGDAYAIEHIGGVGFFDGSNDYVDVGDISSLNFPDNFTIGTWIKTNPLIDQSVIFKMNNAAGYGYALYLRNGKVWARLYNGVSEIWPSFFSNSIVIDGTWHHVVIVREKGTQGKIYVDGALDQTISDNNANIDYGPFKFLIGGGYDSRSGYPPSSNTDPFKGQIDEVLAYNRSLNAFEINQIYQRSIKGLRNNITSGLVSYWYLDSNFTDYSGMNNHGTPQNGAFSTNISYSATKIAAGKELNVAGAVLTDTDGNAISSSTNSSVLQITKSGDKKVEFTAEGILDLSQVLVDSDSERTFVHKLNSSTPGVSGTHTIFIPNVRNQGVYICPSATSLAEVIPTCSNVGAFSHAECVAGVSKPIGSDTVKCEIDGANYKVSGLSTSGGGNNPPGGVSDAVPEFSDYALILAIVVSITGLFVVRSKHE